MKRLVLICMLALACSSAPEPGPDSTPESTSTSPPTTTTPTPQMTTTATPAAGEATKEGAVDTLNRLAMALTDKDYKTAETLVQIPQGFPMEEFAGEMEKSFLRDEISVPGVAILAEMGTWGPAREVFEPERAQGWADAAEVPIDMCWGLTLDPAEAMLVYDGESYRVIRFDDIGKLEP